MIYKTFNSLEDITVDIFFKILETREYSLMYVNDGAIFKFLRKYLFKSRKRAYENYHVIYEKYSEKTESKNAKNYFLLIEEINRLQVRYITLTNLIASLNELNKGIIGREILAWGFIFNPKGKVLPQKKQLERQLRAASNKVIRKQSELEEISNEQKKEKTSVLKNAFQLEHITGIKIDLKKNTMIEYLELIDFAKEIVEQKRESMQQQNGNV